MEKLISMMDLFSEKNNKYIINLRKKMRRCNANFKNTIGGIVYGWKFN